MSFLCYSLFQWAIDNEIKGINLLDWLAILITINNNNNMNSFLWDGKISEERSDNFNYIAQAHKSTMGTNIEFSLMIIYFVSLCLSLCLYFLNRPQNCNVCNSTIIENRKIFSCWRRLFRINRFMYTNLSLSVNGVSKISYILKPIMI